MEWIDLVTPAAAVFALFLALALVVQSIRQSRAIRRVEQQLAEGAGTAQEEALERVRQLQVRMDTSEGVKPQRSGWRTAGIAVAVVVVVALIAGGVWALVIRDGDATAAGDQQADTPARTTEAETPRAPSQTVVGEPPALADKSQFEIAVFNASGVDGAANNTIAPAIRAEGYQVPLVADSPDGRDDLAVSVVMWPEGGRAVARNVAKDLGIAAAPPLDGFTADQIGGADAVVLIGSDIVSAPAPTTTP